MKAKQILEKIEQQLSVIATENTAITTEKQNENNIRTTALNHSLKLLQNGTEGPLAGESRKLNANQIVVLFMGILPKVVFEGLFTYCRHGRVLFAPQPASLQPTSSTTSKQKTMAMR